MWYASMQSRLNYYFWWIAAGTLLFFISVCPLRQLLGTFAFQQFECIALFQLYSEDSTISIGPIQWTIAFGLCCVAAAVDVCALVYSLVLCDNIAGQINGIHYTSAGTVTIDCICYRIWFALLVACGSHFEHDLLVVGTGDSAAVVGMLTVYPLVQCSDSLGISARIFSATIGSVHVAWWRWHFVVSSFCKRLLAWFLYQSLSIFRCRLCRAVALHSVRSMTLIVCHSVLTHTRRLHLVLNRLRALVSHWRNPLLKIDIKKWINKFA